MSDSKTTSRNNPPKPKPVPADATKQKEIDPAKEKILPGRLKVKKVEPNQPRRKTPVVQLPKPEPRQPRFSHIGLKIKNFARDNSVKAAIALLIIGGILLFFMLRETRFQAAIEPGSLRLEEEAQVVLDFSERITMIKNSLDERLVPLRASLEEAENSLGAAQADYAGRMQSKKLLMDTLDQDEKKMSELINETRGELDVIWDEEFKKLDQAQTQAKIDLNNKIKERAESLNISLNLNPDLDVPDVTVNAFRLALYAVPKEVDVNAERTWVENLLQDWKKNEEKLAQKRKDLRSQVQKVREPLGGQLDEIQKRMARMKEESTLIDENLAMIQEEINRFEARAASLRREIQNTIDPFYEDLLRAPKDYVLFSFPIVDNLIDARELEKNTELKPGQYRLLIRGTRDGEEYWCLQDFEIKDYKTTQLVITPDQFTPVKSYLE